MITVFKYPVQSFGELIIDLPAGAQVLHVAHQDGKPFLWAKVDTNAKTRLQRFCLVATGHEIPDGAQSLPFVGSFQTGPHVFHLFGGIYA